LASAVLGHAVDGAPCAPRRRHRIWGTWTRNLSARFPARPLAIAAALPLALLLAPAPAPAAAASGDWPTYLHDAQRTSANLDESSLTTGNVSQLVPLWSVATGGPVASGTTVAGGTAYFGSWDGNEYAVDAATGAVRWKTFLGVTRAPGCFPPAAGVTSTPAVQGGVVYVGGGDSNWYALDATTGAVLWSVFTGDDSATGGHYNWSSPLLFNGFAYIGVASFGDCPLVPGQLLEVDLSTHKVVATFDAVASGQVGGGIWTSPSLDVTTSTIYVDTGSPGAAGQPYSQAIVALDAGTLAVRSGWKIPPSAVVDDSDWSTSPILFTDSGSRQLVGAVNKNGLSYAFDRTNLAAGPVWQRPIAYGGQCPTCGDASAASAAFAGGVLYVAGGNTTIAGSGAVGSVRALGPADGAVLWEHPDPAPVVAALAYANGLIVAGAGPTLEVLAAATGKRLYSYTTGAAIYGPPTVSGGRIYTGSVDGHLYAWGLPASPPPPPPADPTCPAGWTCQDVGGAQPAGSESVSGSTWTVNAGGAGVGATADQFRLVTRTMSGDGQVTGAVTAQASPAAGEGLMVRQTADPGAPFYAVMLTPDGLAVEDRVTPGAGAVRLATVPATLPVHLQVRRVGDAFQAATSGNGTAYSLVPGTDAVVPMPADAMAGAAADSGSQGTPAGVTFAGVALGAAGSPASPAPPASSCPSGWACGDVGNPGVVGDQSLGGGTWTVHGAGGDIWDVGDQFHFVSQSLAGDGTVSARVASQGATDPWAKAGVMLRQSSSDAASVYYALLVTPGNGLVVQYRANEGLRTLQPARPAGAAPAFVRVARSGGTFTAYTSADGSTWTPVAGSSVTFTTGATMLAGLAVTSHSSGTTSAVTFDTVGVATGAPPALCPSGWTCTDVGGATPSGAQTLDGSATWTVQGGGGDIWGTSDQFHFVSQSLAGDGPVTARVTAQTATDPWAKAGVMLRQTTDAASAYYDVEVTPANGLVVQYRPSSGAAAVTAAQLAGASPVYVRAVRAGTTFTAYTSSDGLTWAQVAGSGVTLGVSGAMQAGLAVTSHNTEAAGMVTFTAVGVGAIAPPGGCPAGWTCADVGAATPGGSQTLDGTSLSVQGGGGDIWGTADEFRLVALPVTGDATATARVSAQGNTNAWAKAGVMLRQTAGAGSVYYAAELTPGNGVVMQYRASTGGAAAMAVGVAGTAPDYLRVARSGATFTAYTSPDGTTWTPVAGSSLTLSMSGGMLAGLAVTSHDTTSLSTVTFDGVSVATSAPAPPGACPSGWSCADVGGAFPAGTQTLNGPTWTVQGGGGDIWGTSDQFRFVCQTAGPAGTVSARVVSQTASSPWAKAGAMLRQDAGAGSAYYAIEVTPGNGLVVQFRASAGAAAATAVSLAGTAPAYVRVVRAGGTFTAYTSTDGATWTALPGSSETLSVTGTMLGGLAVTSHDTAALSTATFTSVTVSG
jgi:outer membrane protein assembly factor BamB